MRLLILCTALALIACQPPEPPPVQGEIAGYWHGQRWRGNARVYWLSHYGADGNIDIEFLTCYAGRTLDQTREYGEGRFEDGILYTTLDRIVEADGDTWVAGVDDRDNDGAPDPPHTVDYRMLELTETMMRYESLARRERFEAQRVDETYELACPPARAVVDTRPGGRSGADGWVRRGVGSEDDDTQAVPEIELRELLGAEPSTED